MKESKTSKKPKPSGRKILLRAVTVVCVCLVLLFAAAVLIERYQKREVSLPVIQSENDYLTKSFRSYYPVDFDADLSKDKEYTALNREIMYSDSSGSGITYSLSDLEKSELNEGQRFFKKYFEMAINGDYELYPELFTDNYKKEPVGFEKTIEREFPPQRIYNITIKEIARTDKNSTEYTYEGKPCVFGFYEVSFMILKNDGCFRRDLPENASRPLIFELVTFDCETDSEKTLIKNLYTPNSLIKSYDENNDESKNSESETANS